MEFTLDGDNIVDEESFYDEIAKVCCFPDYFGRNLDALNDCLYDLSTEHPGATIAWLNVHPYLRSVAASFNESKEMKKDLLEHMKEICMDHGITFRA